MPNFGLYLIWATVGIINPLIIADYPPPDVYRARYVTALISGAIGGVLGGLLGQAVLGSSESLSVIVVAASLGTIVYGGVNAFTKIGAKTER